MPGKALRGAHETRRFVGMPPADVAEVFGTLVKPLQQAITSNHSRAGTLGALRDALLPRLISGQLRLPEAAAVAAA